MTREIINRLLSLGVLGLAVIAVLSLAYVLINRQRQSRYVSFISEHILWFVFVISLFATAGSLYYSEIVGFEPCKLCWLQRIFMYPLVLLAGLAAVKKNRGIVDYILPLSIIGFVISAYHNYIYFGGKQLSSCDASGLDESCLRRLVTEFGFVTIPFMALGAFISIIVFILIAKSYSRQRN